MRNMRTWKRLYKKAIKENNYHFIDEVIMSEIWGIKWVNKAYEKYARSLGKDPMAADEQTGLSLRWADEFLFQ